MHKYDVRIREYICMYCKKLATTTIPNLLRVRITGLVANKRMENLSI